MAVTITTFELADIGNIIDYKHGLHFYARKWIHIEIEKKFNLIHEKEWTGETVLNICKRYGKSRKSYYKWKNRYK